MTLIFVMHMDRCTRVILTIFDLDEIQDGRPWGPKNEFKRFESNLLLYALDHFHFCFAFVKVYEAHFDQI